MIQEYRVNNLVKGSEIKELYLFKLYSKAIHNNMRTLTVAGNESYKETIETITIKVK